VYCFCVLLSNCPTVIVAHVIGWAMKSSFDVYFKLNNDDAPDCVPRIPLSDTASLVEPRMTS
jgi:hypothetical protein